MYLPDYIWCIIFQYDSTYHEKYRDVLKDFKAAISWKVVWVNSDRKTMYRLSEEEAEYTCAYWNETYATHYGFSQSENPQQCCTVLVIKDS